MFYAVTLVLAEILRDKREDDIVCRRGGLASSSTPPGQSVVEPTDASEGGAVTNGTAAGVDNRRQLVLSLSP